MSIPFRKQVTQYSRITNMSAQTQGLGTLNPVHIQDIVKEKNLDYLQSLGQLVQRYQVNPVWFQYESNQNKMKFFQIYQLSLAYAKNTQTLYTQILNQLDQQFQTKKNKVNKLKSDILSHKQKTNKLKKHYRKQKLNKQKQKVLNYERSIKKIRDQMLKQKKQLEAKNQKNFTQYNNSQKNSSSENQSSNPFNYIQFSPGFAYPPQSYSQFNPFPFTQQSPIHTPTQHSPKNIFNPPNKNLNNNQQQAQKVDKNSSKNNISNKYSVGNNIDKIKEDKTKNTKNQQKQSYFQSKSEKPRKKQTKIEDEEYEQVFEDVDSVIEDHQHKNQPQKPKVKQQLKKSGQKPQNVRNTVKSYSFQQSGNIRSSNFESEKGDQVKQLKNINQSNRKNVLESKTSNKSIDLFQDDSIMNIQLKTESKNDVLDDKKKFNNLAKQTSIIEEVNNKSGIIKKKSSQQSNPKNEIKKENVRFKQQLQQVKTYDDKMSIKISNVTKINQNSPEANKKNNINYLLKSNQGNIYASGVSGAGSEPQQINPKMKLKLKQSNNNNLGVSINSLEDVESKRGSKSYNDEEQYQLQFQNMPQNQQSQGTKNTRVKINVQYSDQSPSAHRFNEFVPLYKNYFIRKQDVKDLGDSSVSGIGSLKELSVKFLGSQRKHTHTLKSHMTGSQSDNIQLIDMPQNSYVAKPSKLKKSTIYKQSISKIVKPKLSNSHDAKSTIIKPTQQQAADHHDDTFKILGDLDLKSKKIVRNNQNLLRVSKPQQKLALSLAESHVIQQQKVTEQRDSNQEGQLQQSIKLSVIPESQNQSLFTQNSNKHKILQLIDKKYSQKGPVTVEKDLITKQIKEVLKKNNAQLSWQQLIETFTEMAKEKNVQVTKLKDQRLRKVKEFKQQISNKIPSKLTSERAIPKNKKSESKTSDKSDKVRSKQQDDLNYSQSMVENPLSEKVGSKESEVSVKNKIQNYNNSRVQKSSKQGQNKQGRESKFLKDQKNNSDINARIRSKIIQASSYDKDDQLQNTLKNNYQEKKKAKNKNDDSDDGF